jgi:hypothetical protein
VLSAGGIDARDTYYDALTSSNVLLVAISESVDYLTVGEGIEYICSTCLSGRCSASGCSRS